MVGPAFYTGDEKASTRPDIAALVGPFARWVSIGVAQDAQGARAGQDVPAVWVLAHRGYSGSRRLSLWAYPSHADALEAGARLAIECGLDQDEQYGAAAQAAMEKGHHRKVLELYEQSMPEWALMRVEPAWLQVDPQVMRVRELRPASLDT